MPSAWFKRTSRLSLNQNCELHMPKIFAASKMPVCSGTLSPSKPMEKVKERLSFWRRAYAVLSSIIPPCAWCLSPSCFNTQACVAVTVAVKAVSTSTQT